MSNWIFAAILIAYGLVNVFGAMGAEGQNKRWPLLGSFFGLFLGGVFLFLALTASNHPPTPPIATSHPDAYCNNRNPNPRAKFDAGADRNTSTYFYFSGQSQCTECWRECSLRTWAQPLILWLDWCRTTWLK